MTSKIHTSLKSSALTFGAIMVVSTSYASSDYGPAIWNPPSGCTKYYTSGYGHKFHVCHDMEGHYLSSISLLRSCSSTVSVHYAVNGKQDTSTDAGAGEITQMILEADYAWHACCWNKYSTGTEHEGFVSNPAWYTEAMYQASSGISRHEAQKFGYATDRNHIVGHNEHLNAAWSSWASANFGINPACNSHTDPGAYWDWSHYMALINGINPPWLFGSDVQGFTAGNNTTAPWWAGGSWPGTLVTDQLGNDEFIYSPPTSFTAPGDSVVSVNVYAQNGNTATHDMQVFFETTSDKTWTAGKSSPIVTYSASNSWNTINLNVDASGAFSGAGIAQMRLDFDNVNHGNRWIVNHMVVQSSYRFTFDSTTMGWTAGNSLTAPWWYNTGWPGVLVTDQTGDDAYMLADPSWFAVGSGHPFNYLGGSNDKIHVRVYPQNGNTANHDMAIYWTDTSGGWSEAKSVHVNYTAQNAWADVYIPVGTNSNWPSAHVTQIRLDFDAINHGNRWIVDYINFEH